MTESLQPLENKSEFPPLPPRELLGRLIRGISNRPVDPTGKNTVEVTQTGQLCLSKARFLSTEIITQTPLMPLDMARILPKSILRLDVYNSTGKGYLERSVIMSEDTDGTVVGNIGDKEFDNMTPDREDQFIQDLLNSITGNDRDLKSVNKQINKQRPVD